MTSRRSPFSATAAATPGTRTTRTRRTTSPSPGGRAAAVGCIPVLVVLAVLIGGGWFVGSWAYDQVSARLAPAPDYDGPGSGRVLYQVTSGASSAAIGRDLKAKDVVKSVDAFSQAARDNDKSRNIQVGYYELKQADEGQRGARRPRGPEQPGAEQGRGHRGRPGEPGREVHRQQDRHQSEGGHGGAGRPEGHRAAGRGQGQPRGLPVPGDLHRAAEADGGRPDQADGRQDRRGAAEAGPHQRRRATWA